MRSEQQRETCKQPNYDFIIVGAGPSGAHFANRAKEKNPDVKILMLERGVRVEKRECPDKKTGHCMKCKPCHTTAGFGGSGATSDGKFTLYADDAEDIYVGGNLHHYIGVSKTIEYVKLADEVHLKFGATHELEGVEFPTEVENIRKDAQMAGLTLLTNPIRHLGTERARVMYEKIQNHLISSGVEIEFGADVLDLIITDGNVEGVKYIVSKEERTVYAPKVILAVGRSGSEWLEKMCKKHQIKSEAAVLDIGVRYELPNSTMKCINEPLYEGKFVGTPPPFHDKARTFCQNPGGLVAPEGNGDITLVNGHSCKDTKTENTNLALLVSIKLGDVENPLDYSRRIARNMNALANGNVMVQRLGDIRRGKRTWPKELEKNSVVPTLKSAVPGDLCLAMPYRIMSDILGFIDMLEKVIPGFAHDDNLLYGTEAKFYSNKVKLNEYFETSVKGLHAIGDAPGVTRGLSQSSANGYYLADVLVV